MRCANGLLRQRLSHPSTYKQYDLFLEVRTSSTDPKMLDHAVFILEDDGSVATFSVASPEPVDSHAAAAAEESSVHAGETGTVDDPREGALANDLFSPNSIATSASSFVRHLNELVDATDPALAAIQTFPHPRVRSSPLGEPEPQTAPTDGGGPCPAYPQSMVTWNLLDLSGGMILPVVSRALIDPCD